MQLASELSISLPFEHSQTMKFTQQQKLIGFSFPQYMYYMQTDCGHSLD